MGAAQQQTPPPAATGDRGPATRVKLPRECRTLQCDALYRRDDTLPRLVATENGDDHDAAPRPRPLGGLMPTGGSTVSPGASGAAGSAGRWGG
jgi:hypothetical protein